MRLTFRIFFFYIFIFVLENYFSLVARSPTATGARPRPQMEASGNGISNNIEPQQVTQPSQRQLRSKDQTNESATEAFW